MSELPTTNTNGETELCHGKNTQRPQKDDQNVVLTILLFDLGPQFLSL